MSGAGHRNQANFTQTRAMAITDIYSKRASRAAGEFGDVYSYDDAPRELRNQIIHILDDLLGTRVKYADLTANDLYTHIDRSLSREYGAENLTEFQYGKSSVERFILTTKNVSRLLDVVELSFRICPGLRLRNPAHAAVIGQLLEEFNQRCRESAFGYHIEQGLVIRVDSTYAHSEIVKPTLTLLAQDIFSGPNQEFLNAHEHFRHDRYKECIVDCLKAFESTMKAIATVRGWTIPTKATAKNLIDACFEHELIDPMLRSHFTGLRTTLEAGVPTLRNRVAGHGQGAVPIAVPGYLAQYVLNLTGTNISMLAHAHAQTK
ncbi:hypothetical protein LMG1861_05098 [Achromobacter piechaudii]|uniref:Abortive infection protein-like C-terminal domain-containing protein n=2 Tax=Achromobacter piechaudii TaxID=72556 RepID=A0A6S7EKE2_9BURK|nr:hypothetical protein LMG1861_05098 [Achromobacter piechaudii]